MAAGWVNRPPRPLPPEVARAAETALAARRGARFRDPEAVETFLTSLRFGWRYLEMAACVVENDEADDDLERARAETVERLAAEFGTAIHRLGGASRSEIGGDLLFEVSRRLLAVRIGAGRRAEGLRRGRGEGRHVAEDSRRIARAAAAGWEAAGFGRPSARGSFADVLSDVLDALGFERLGADAIARVVDETGG